MHYVFTAKGIVMPLAAFGIFGWCMHEGGGIEAMSLVSKGKPRTMNLGWSIMSGINVIMGGLSPLLVNQPDLARYCQKPSHAGIASGFCLFASSLITFFLGLASTTSIQAVWGVAYWNVWDLLDAILDHYWTPGSRAGVFFVGFAFVLGTVAHNFGANSIPFGADMTGIFPKWLTIRRGQILCAILGVVTVPWKLMSSASQFLSFLGSYNIFMAPTCAVMIVDYFYVRRGNIHVPSCYDGRKGGLYWFSYGVHWLGVFAWAAGASMGIPGLIGEYQPQAINDAARKMYMMGWVLTFTTAAVVYATVTSFTKIRLFPSAHEDSPKTWEWLAEGGKEGFYEEEGERGFYTSTGVATMSGEFDAEKAHADTRETVG